jgi:hypothetical protein
MKDVYRTLQEKAYELAVANKLLQGTVKVNAKVLSTEEAIGNPEEDDFPLQKGKERLMEWASRMVIKCTTLFSDYPRRPGHFRQTMILERPEGLATFSTLLK